MLTTVYLWSGIALFVMLLGMDLVDYHKILLRDTFIYAVVCLIPFLNTILGLMALGHIYFYYRYGPPAAYTTVGPKGQWLLRIFNMRAGG